MRCLKCGHEWEPKVDQPRRCPNCKTAAYQYPPGIGVRAVPRINEGDAGIYNPEAEEPVARLGNRASTDAPESASSTNTRKRDTRKVKVVSEPKGWSDPTPLVTVAEMTLGEARRRYPDATVAPVRVAVGIKGDPENQNPHHPFEKGETLFILDEAKEPDMDELRKIASGEISPTGGVNGADKTAKGILSGGGQNSDGVLSTPCPYRELDPEANEWVYCSLAAHGPKVKHVPGRRESA
jgi:hypothetical protein